MVKSKRFATLNKLPSSVVAGMHPDTKAILDRIRATKSKVLTVKMKDSRDAKNRQSALRRARLSKHVQFKEAHRKGAMLYIKIR